MSKRKRLTHYLDFFGDRADICATNKEGDLLSATIYFAGGAIEIFVDGGHIVIADRQDLSAFIAKLPRYAAKLKKRLLKLKHPHDEGVALDCGKNDIFIKGTADVDRFVQQITARDNELKEVLPQVEVCAELARKLRGSYRFTRLGRFC